MDTSAISQTLESLSQQLQAEKARLSSFMNPETSSFVQAFSTVQHLQSSLSTIGISLEDLPSLSSVSDLRQELQQACSLANTVLGIHAERSRFEDREEELIPLVELVSRQEAELRAVEEGEDFFITAAQDLVARNKSKLIVEVANLGDDLIAWSKSGCTLRLAIQRGKETISLKSLHKMTNLLGEQEQKACETSDHLLSLLSKLIIDDCLDEDRTSEAVKITIGKSKHDSSLPSILQQVSQLLKFTYFDLSQRDQSLFQLFNRSLNLSVTLFPALKRKLLQGNAASLAALSAFLSVLTEVHYPQEAITFVQRIIANAEAEIVTFRCEMLIEQARDLILCQDSMNRTVSDQTEKWSISSKQGKKREERLAFVMSKMQVSDSVMRLVECLQEFMQEIEKKPATAALEMLISARSCIQLFYSLRHYSQESNIRNSHISAALFYNDCLYFSHHLALISAEMGPHLPDSSSDMRVLSDFEPLIKSRAQECFLSLCADIKRTIREKTQQLNVIKLSGNYQEAEEMLLAVVSQITTEATSLGNVLAQEDFSHFLGIIVEFAAGNLLEKIFALKQVARDDETALQQLIDQFLSLGQLFAQQQPAAFVTSWRKLEVVKEILESDMNGILKLFAEGKIAQALSFEELTKLIEAMFEDSVKRRESLKIMTGGNKP